MRDGEQPETEARTKGIVMEKRRITLNGTEFTLGEKYRDGLTDQEGTAIAGGAYLTGCDQLQLLWNDTTGRPVEWWVDVTRIEGVAVEPRDGGPAPMIPARHP